MGRRVGRPSALLLLALLISACGDGGEENGATAPAELTAVTLRLNFVTDASAAPFYYAVAQGWYEEAGLDVEIQPGQGSLISAQTVGGGDDEFGYVTADAAIRAITEGLDLQIVTVLQRQSNMTVVHHPESTVEGVEDLFDLQIISAEFLPQPTVLRGLVASQGADPEELDIINADIAAWPSLYEQTPNGAVLGRIGNEDVRFEGVDDVQFATYAELGLEDFLGNTLIANGVFAEENPELTAGFVQASVRAFEAAMEDPEPVMDAIESALDDLGPREPATRELLGTLSVTPGRGVEDMAIVPTEASWIDDMLGFLEEHMGLEGSLDPGEYFTNQYLDAP